MLVRLAIASQRRGRHAEPQTYVPVPERAAPDEVVLPRRHLLVNERRRVTRDGERIGLTTTEFDLLRHMASRPGRVYTRAQLLERVRDYEAIEADERTINVHISHLREKVEDDPSDPAFIHTVRGAGYAFAER